MPITRKDNWTDLLTEFIESRNNEPFCWGHNDCCLFASDWIKLCTGVDPAETLRGKYDSELTAARVLKKHGGVDGVIAEFVEPLGAVRVDPKFAQRGDLAVRFTGKGDGIGIVIGNFAAFVGANGLLFAPLDGQAELRCWRI
jgi:hypothetical protein